MNANEILLKNLEAMGFEKELSKEALIKTGNQSVAEAVEWISSHQNKDDGPIGGNDVVEIDDKGNTTKPPMDPKEPTSWKCVETGRIFKTMKDLELYAERTGRSNFEETTEKAKARTKEEIAKAREELKEKIRRKRLEREKAEKKAQIEREKARRAAGKFEGTMREEGLRLKRKRDQELRRKEKRDAARALALEKKRWAMQEAEKAAERAMKLGIPISELKKKSTNADDSKTKMKNKAHPLDRVKTALQVLRTYSAGGEGEKAIKLLRIYVKNVLEKGETDEKFLRINMGNKHFVKRIKPLKGGTSLLKAIGFEIHRDDSDYPDGVLKMSMPFDRKLMEETIGAMQRALSSMN